MAIGTTSAGPGVPLTIPVIDLAPLAAGAPGASDTVTAALADALDRVGFFFIIGHGVAADLVSPRLDHMIECLPSCQGPGDPPRYAPITYGEYVAWFTGQNYHGEADAPPPR